VLTEIKNRGVADVCVVVCDGLKGLPEAVNAVWDRAVIQTCVIHLLRNTFRYASRKYWDQIAKDIRPVYTAPTEATAKERFVEFTAKWGAQYPAIIRLWESAWSEFVPFLDYDVEIRRIICSTNAVVIWSAPVGVLDVRHKGLRVRFLPGGRGYLQSSRRQIPGRRSVCYAGGFAGLVA
jgi:putative transposase